MVEVIAATTAALLTACFVSDGSISLRSRQQRDDHIRLTSAVTSLENRVINMLTDVRDIYSRLRHVDIELAKLTKTQ